MVPIVVAVFLLLSLSALIRPRFGYLYSLSTAGVPHSLPEVDFHLNRSGQELESAYCNARFSPRYLEELRDTSIDYCSPESPSNLTCFHSHTQPNDDRDSFCFAQSAVLDPTSRRFNVFCDARSPNSNESARGIVPLNRIRGYWYNTGPGYVLNHHVSVKSESPLTPPSHVPSDDRPITILVKREGAFNIWHSLMEIWSVTMSLDVLRLSQDLSRPDRALFQIPEDTPKTQIVLLDDHPEGPLFDLWRAFSGREPVRFSKILDDPAQAQVFVETPQNLVLPLAGGSNPLWQNDWEDRDCKEAPLLRLFTRRVMHHFSARFDSGPRKAKALNVTLINRTASRRLLGLGNLLGAAMEKFPGVNFQVFDFGDMSFVEQLRVVQSTDVLVGVHGAGLTHTMFLREGAAAVVEIQPSILSHKGFRNLAQMLGQKYFSTHAEMVEPEGQGVAKRDLWHSADVRIEKEAFLELVGKSIDSLEKR
ncbi:DUF563 domain-containing protein [Colletotrichum sojae]|uniref:EGF domain-specific O-linked N-acetylglucosamine transferase n=1 Tax=Colletotrichum sojae TaxID=2175907 RepID=A0A8H6MPU5_9PEZI|nr:DUF563 domain-containing protein [Colletotrichum sojae]